MSAATGPDARGADPGRRLTAAPGTAGVLHRLALAVRPLDAHTRAPAGPGLRVGWESGRVPGRRTGQDGRVRSLERHEPAGFVLRYGVSGTPGEVGAAVSVRIDDPARRWIPRRFAVPLWTRAELADADATPPTAPHVRADARLLLPWMVPGPAYPLPQGMTGIRLRVTRPGPSPTPVRWPRVEAFGPGGVLVGWAHGDEHGQVLLLIGGDAPLPFPPPPRFDVALRTHAPDAGPPPPPGSDPLAGLVAEAVVRSVSPPRPQDLDNDVLRGLAPPPGYRTCATDTVRTLTVGQVVPAGDLPHTTDPPVTEESRTCPST
ncbi:hypothetical protein ABT084_07155 [Streptomyces sp. NPDC002138]|uniref:hypothetical protein n=1 Tax=Streptomyces sp. NPDC002138 TaxID=3154410 RepID=UPI00331821E0